MYKDITIKTDLKKWYQENMAALEDGRLFRPTKRFRSITGDYIVLGLSGLASIVSLACLVLGMANGFWSGNNSMFSFYALINSPSGIIMLLGYFTSLNVFYSHLVKVNKRFRIIKK